MTNLEKLMQRLPENIDCALITSDVSRYYFTGMRSSAGTLVVTKKSAYMIIDFRYIEKAKNIIKNAEVILQENTYEQVEKILADNNVKTVAVESEYMTLRSFTTMRDKLPNRTIVDTNELSDIIIDLRAHKSEAELVSMRKAQAIADKTFTYMCGFLKAGMTEIEAATELERKMTELGGEGTSFDTIMVSGVNSSLPHGVPSHKKIENGDFVTMDFGTKADGYCSDMTRTVAIGHTTPEMEKVYDTVLKANLASHAAIKIGESNVAVDKAGRDLINAAGYEKCFGHGTGHSLGLEIHEDPRYSPTAKGVVEVGHVMTVEPGVYLAGKFGVRIEDMVYIGENGADIITTSTKELLVLNN